MTTSTTCPHDDDPTTCPPCNRHLVIPDAWGTRETYAPQVRIAAYKSRCDVCPDPILEGDSIVMMDDVWVHEECR